MPQLFLYLPVFALIFGIAYAYALAKYRPEEMSKSLTTRAVWEGLMWFAVIMSSLGVIAWLEVSVANKGMEPLILIVVGFANVFAFVAGTVFGMMAVESKPRRTATAK